MTTDFGPMESVLADLARASEPFSTAEGVAFLDRVESVLKEDNRDARVAGVDRLGESIDSYAPLAESTVKRRKGTGPALAPRGPDSRVVTGFQTDKEVSPNRAIVRSGFVGQPWIVHHIDGAGRNPQRDVGGPREEAAARIQAEWDQLMRSLTGGS